MHAQVLDLIHPSLFPLVYGLSRRMVNDDSSSHSSHVVQQQQQQRQQQQGQQAAPEVPAVESLSPHLERLSIATGTAPFLRFAVHMRRNACQR